MRIEYELAGIASRAGAVVADTVVQALGALGLILLRALMLISEPGFAATWSNAILGVAIFLMVYGYFLLFETLWNGQTPGKKWARLRVVREGGLPIDLQRAAVRNLIRIIDFLPVFYVVGGLSMLATSRYQRLGDVAAGTLVVKERAEQLARNRATSLRVDRPEVARVANIELVTPEEFEIVKRFVERRAELRPAVREELAAKIAAPLAERLGFRISPEVRSSDLLFEIYSRCMAERGMR